MERLQSSRSEEENGKALSSSEEEDGKDAVQKFRRGGWKGYSPVKKWRMESL
jgi:hypothetical protein